MNYQDLSFSARLLDPITDQPPVKVRRATFAGIPTDNADELLALFFEGENVRYLLRSDVMALSHRRNIDLFALCVLFWGFPTNQHGICKKAFQNWPALRRWIQTLRRNRSMTGQQFEDMIPTMDRGLPGLAISTLSKYLYYTGCSIDGHSCLILDNQVAKGVANLTGNEFDQLRNAVVNRHRYYRNYPSYLEAMHILSVAIGVPAQNIEYVLWLAGKHNL